MLYKCNVIVSSSISILAVYSFLSYFWNNQNKILFWAEKCDNDFSCTETYMKGPAKPLDEDFIAILKDDYIIPPPPEPIINGFDIYVPVWRKLIDWDKIQQSFIKIFHDQPPGNFVEIGAVDGDFMSQTLYLEKNLSWTGVLLEPDPRSFAVLKKNKRNAWIAPLCVLYNYPSVRKYWIRTLEEDLPYHFLQLLMARSKIYEEILVGDEERGTSIWVPCVPLTSILTAINMTTVDLVTISTGGDSDETKIKDILRSKLIEVKFLLIHFPTSRLYNEPYPQIPGYILDVRRSQILVKLYVNEKFCQLTNNSTCEAVNHWNVLKACLTYFCNDYLTVKAIDPLMLP